jgi:hypothetical protein
MKDRNKTTLTHEVTTAITAWLDDRGFKPIETEVPICSGWCADLAGVITPTQTEQISLGLLPRYPSYNLSKETRLAWHAKHPNWDALHRSLSRVMTCLVEVKTTRGDYRGDHKWTLPQPTDLAYVVFPRDLVRPEEWPAGWGILEYHEGAIKRLRVPTPFSITDSQQRDVILSIAIRRDHHTRYARFRESQKETRLAAVTEISMDRIRDVAHAVLCVARGEHGNLEECLMYTRLRHHMNTMPEWVLEPLRELYGIANRQASPPTPQPRSD